MNHASNDRPQASNSQLEAVAEMARRLAEAEDLDDLLQRIVVLGEQRLDGCDGVSLMLVGSGGCISSPAYSSKVSYESDMVQYETNQGPCLESIREHHTVLIDDLERDERWPAYRDRVLELGMRSMLGVRLFVLGDTMGALNFYSTKPHAFDERSKLLAQVLASHAAVAMKAAISEAGTEAALQTRDVIGQAKGILMERHKLSPTEAFERLRRISQLRHIKLRDLAQDVAETGAVPGEP
jgi:GAF domain-containing protein